MATTKDILERAYANIQKDGWWGIGRDGKTFYSRSKRERCECAGLAILSAAEELRDYTFDVSKASELACAAFLNVTSYDREAAQRPHLTEFGHVTKWNDVKGRHFATVKRAFVRAIAAAA